MSNAKHSPRVEGTTSQLVDTMANQMEESAKGSVVLQQGEQNDKTCIAGTPMAITYANQSAPA